MACTLKDLQDTEYDILCKFADFCDKYKLGYNLSGGTLLGAVRHDGMIPWDDDIDVYMNVQDFKRFVKLIKKHPIEGYHLSWIDTDLQHPHLYAKLKKNGTFFLSYQEDSLDIHNGVFIDIFAYSGAPKSDFAKKLQHKIYYLYTTLTYFYKSYEDNFEDSSDAYKKTIARLSKWSYKRINRTRKCLFSIYSSLGSKNSKEVVINDWYKNEIKLFPREYYTPTTNHIFNDREFKIPVNYDTALTNQYGDYMTPVQFDPHTNLNRIQLFHKM